MKKKILLFLVLIALLQCFVPVVRVFSSGEIDATTIVSWVEDGDTFNTISEGWVRLADINTPELGEPGYYDARNFLISVVYNKQVQLDIDDVHRTDKYGRLVCVVYVEYNSTHFKNVNNALLVEGFALIWDFDNEFDPYTWTLYVPKNEMVPEFQSFVILLLFMTATLLAVTIHRRKHSVAQNGKMSPTTSRFLCYEFRACELA